MWTDKAQRNPRISDLDQQAPKMPMSDTWPGGAGLEVMTSMDSAGSCDSFVSAHSGSSDDSMDHLSAEEKACLMFLEETIESLDTDDDSGLSNDESDQMPGPGHVAAKVANLTAAMKSSRLNGSPQLSFEEPVQHYQVPPRPVLGASPDILTDKNFTSKPPPIPPNHILEPAAPQVPLEVNVVISPPTKPKDLPVKAAEVPLPRGPLSYEALFYLRRSASTKKTPLCPTVDHTIESDKQSQGTKEGQHLGYPQKAVRFHPEVSISKLSPPAVPPKPKKIPASTCLKTHREGSIKVPSNTIRHAQDPKMVRLQALQKLGLLEGEEAENHISASPPSLNLPSNGLTKDPPCGNPGRSPSFSHAQVGPEPKTKPLQSSASFHHYSRHEQQPVFVSNPPQSNGVKAAGRERSNTLDNHRTRQTLSELKSSTSSKPAQPDAVPYTVMVVPGMGADRREALRKLGLLKV